MGNENCKNKKNFEKHDHEKLWNSNCSCLFSILNEIFINTNNNNNVSLLICSYTCKKWSNVCDTFWKQKIMEENIVEEELIWKFKKYNTINLDNIFCEDEKEKKYFNNDDEMDNDNQLHQLNNQTCKKIVLLHYLTKKYNGNYTNLSTYHIHLQFYEFLYQQIQEHILLKKDCTFEGKWTDSQQIFTASIKILFFLIGLEKIIKINYPNIILFPNAITIKDKEIFENTYTWNNIVWIENLVNVYIQMHKKICWYKIKRMQKKINNTEKFKIFEIKINEENITTMVENNNIIEKLFQALILLIQNLDDENINFFLKKEIILIKENHILNKNYDYNKIILPIDFIIDHYIK